MASLTADLGLANSSHRVIDPQNNKGPTFLEGLANVATAVVSRGSDLYRSAQAEGRRSAAATEQAANRKAESDAAGFALDAKTGRYDTSTTPAQQQVDQTVSVPVIESDTFPVPIDSELEGAPLPPDVTRTVSTLQRAQAAEQQGRAPVGSARIRIEAALADLRAAHPDRQDVIYKTLKDAGIDHYIFREATIAKEVFETEIEAEMGMLKSYVDIAVKAGAVLPGTDPYSAAAAGQRIAKRDDDLAYLRSQQEAARAAATEGRADFQFNQQNADREATTAYVAKGNEIITPLFNTLTSRITNAGFTDDQGNVKSLNSVIPVAQASINKVYENLISEAVANGAPSEVVNRLRGDRDDKLKMIDNMLTGEASVFKVRERAVKSIEQQLGMNAMEAMPTYFGLVEVFGSGAVNEMFQGNLMGSLPPEVVAELKGDLQNVRGAIDTAPERMTMAKLAAVLRGQTGIDTMTETEARKAIPALGTAHRANASAVANGTGDQTPYLNSGIQVANAALELQPGRDRRGYREVVVAQGILFGADQQRADIRLFRENPVEGAIMVQGKRAAAQHTLELGKRTELSTIQRTQGWDITYQATGQYAGTYIATLDRGRYNAYRDEAQRARSGTDAAGYRTGALRQAVVVPTYEETLRNTPQDIRQQVGGMNLSLNYLVATTPFDETLKNVNPAESRRLFALGEVPQAVRARASEAAEQTRNYQSVDQELISQFTDAGRMAEERSQEARTPVPRTQAVDTGINILSARGWNPAAVAGILGNLDAESGFNTTIPGDGGKAKGLAQWHPDRRATAQAQGFDLSDINQAFEFIDWELNNTESAAGRRLKTVTDPVEAANIFAQYFLRPKGAETGNSDNIHNISGRRAAARRYYTNG